MFAAREYSLFPLEWYLTTGYCVKAFPGGIIPPYTIAYIHFGSFLDVISIYVLINHVYNISVYISIRITQRKFSEISGACMAVCMCWGLPQILIINYDNVSRNARRVVSAWCADRFSIFIVFLGCRYICMRVWVLERNGTGTRIPRSWVISYTEI